MQENQISNENRKTEELNIAVGDQDEIGYLYGKTMCPKASVAVAVHNNNLNCGILT